MNQELKEIIIMTANYYRFTLSKQILEMYCEDLEAFAVADVLGAYRAYRKNPKNRTFPLPAQIIDMLDPAQNPEADSREAAAKVQGAIVKFGWANPADAEMYVGPVAWKTIKMLGGWTFLCENMGTNISLTAFQAQFRDLVADKFKKEKAKNLIGLPSPNVIHIGKSDAATKSEEIQDPERQKLINEFLTKLKPMP